MDRLICLVLMGGAYIVGMLSGVFTSCLMIASGRYHEEEEKLIGTAEDNEYVNEIRAWGLTVEELKEIRAAMQKKSLTEVLHEKEEKDRNDEHHKVEN